MNEAAATNWAGASVAIVAADRLVNCAGRGHRRIDARATTSTATGSAVLAMNCDRQPGEPATVVSTPYTHSMGTQ